MAQKQDRSLETEQALMRAAMELCVLKDPDRITVREICSKAGVSVGAFYHHFESKHQLFCSAFESFDRALNAHMEQRCVKKEPLDALTSLLLFQVTFISQEASPALAHYYCAILKDPNHAAVDPERSYYRYAEQCVRRLAEAGQLRPDCTTQKIANLCICFVRGWLIDWVLHAYSYDIVEQVRSVLPILFRGFLRDPD